MHGQYTVIKLIWMVLLIVKAIGILLHSIYKKILGESSARNIYSLKWKEKKDSWGCCDLRHLPFHGQGRLHKPCFSLAGSELHRSVCAEASASSSVQVDSPFFTPCFTTRQALTSLPATVFILGWNSSFYLSDSECVRLTRAAVSMDTSFGIWSSSQMNPSPVMCLKPSGVLSQAMGNKPVDAYLLNALCSMVSQRMASCSPGGKARLDGALSSFG